ncbi:hypothetical protein ANCCAN_26993, partial [Ancylostoma caninum]
MGKGQADPIRKASKGNERTTPEKILQWVKASGGESQAATSCHMWKLWN